MTLANYLYRKSHVINQTAGAGTDYQVPVKIYSGSGEDSADAVYLNDKADYFPNDIAFTASDGDTLLQYWHERDSDTFWLKIPDNLTDGNATIYIYYGQVWASVQPIDFAAGRWVRYASNPVMPHGTTGQWDSGWVAFHSILKNGSTYYGYYNGYGADGKYKIGLATSSDGITWTKHASNPIMDVGDTDEWDDSQVAFPCVWIEGETWYMLYMGRQFEATPKIGLATSSDGITWTKSGSNPVMEETAEAWDSAMVVPGSKIYKDGSTYYLFYWGGTTDLEGDQSTWKIGVATSSSLTSWTKSANNPLLSGSTGEWDDGVLDPHVVKFGETYYMYFQGNGPEETPNHSKIGLASSSNLASEWSKVYTSPILDNNASGQWDDWWTEVPVLVDFGDEWRMYYMGCMTASFTDKQCGYAVFEKTGDGDSTFLLFDDFLHKADIDSAKWTLSPAAAFTRNQIYGIGKYASDSSTIYMLKSVSTIAHPCSIETKTVVHSDWNNETGWEFAVLWDSAWSTSGFLAGHYYTTASYLRKYPGGTESTTNESIAAVTPYKLSLQVSAAAQRYLVNGTQKGALAITPPQADTNVILATGRAASNSAYSTNFYYVFARKWVATEPAHGAWGDEEVLISLFKPYWIQRPQQIIGGGLR